MSFRDELVRCAACGNQFVYTVREQRRRAAKGLPTEAPVFCDDCRGSDVRLAEVADDFEDGEQEAPSAPAQMAGAGTDFGRAAGEPRHEAAVAEATVVRRRESRGGGGRRGAEPRDQKRRPGQAGGGHGPSRSRRPEPPPQTELRVRHLGTVKWFDEDRGFGFIAEEDGEELFVHSTSVLVEGRPALVQGQQVEYEVARTSRGRQAVDVVPLG
jgi:CspA family cold shock protein